MVSALVRRLSLAAVSAAFSLTADAASAEGPKRIINATTITTCPPFEFKDPSGALVGLDIDIFNAMAGKIGAEVNWNRVKL
ncbi:MULTISPECIES: transporter substrate-binding domain-containing protein [unclassified Bradyrhizobium]